MKTTSLLLKNAFKSAWHTKIQIIGLSLLVAFLSALISILSATTESIVVKNNELNSQSNLRDSLINFEKTYRLNKKAYIYQSANNHETDVQDNQSLLQQYLINKLSKDSDKTVFDWSRTEAREFVGITHKNRDLKIKAVTKTKTIDQESTVDKLFVTSGRNISSNKEVVINENFAKLNNIKIGDVIRIEKDSFGNTLKVSDSNLVPDDKTLLLNDSLENGRWKTNFSGFAWLEVVGLGTSADFAAPIIDETTVMPDSQKNLIAYIDPSLFGLEKDEKTNLYLCDMTSAKLYGDEFGGETYFSIKKQDGFDYQKLQKNFATYTEVKDKEKKQLDEIYFENNNKNYKFNNRISMFNKVINSYQITASILLISTLLISLFALLIMIKKQADIVKTQMGCLKALGYRKRELVNNFAAVPIITSAIGCITGYLLSLGFEPIIVGMFSKFFTITFGVYTFSFLSLVNTLFLGFILLLAISFGCIAIVMRTPALKLLSGASTERHSIIQTAIKKPFSKAKFNTKLSVAIFASSYVRFIGAFITMLMATILLSATTIMPKILIDNEQATFSGLNYSNVFEYHAPMENNPMSFYKTYNPTYKEDGKGDDTWGFKDDKGNLKSLRKEAFSPTKTDQEVYSALPYIKDDKNAAKKIIDINKIYNELETGNINSEYYAQNISNKAVSGLIGNTSGWARMGYLNYANLSTNFLKALDKVSVSIPAITGDIAFSTLQKQWPDWVTLTNNLDNNDPNDGNDSLKRVTKTLVWFYQKYFNGVKVTLNTDSYNKKEDGSLVINQKGKEHFKNIFKKSYFNISDGEWTNIVPQISKDKKISDNIKGINLVNFDIDEYFKKHSSKEIKLLNEKLAAWIAITFDHRLSLAVLQTTYSRAPYYVQERIKEAIVNDTNFNITFNIVSYDPQKDTLGTMLNAKMGNNTFKIYGLDKNDFKNMVSFKDDQFKKLFDQKNNLIINKSFAKKMNLKIGQNINVDILKELLADQNGQKVNSDKNEFGFNDYSKYDKFLPSSALPYQSTIDENFSNSGITTNINPVKINGINTCSDNASRSTEQSDIQKAFLKSEIQTKEFKTKQTFKIVGVQDSYGKPQAWTSNETSKNILGYNKIQNDMFAKWFKIQNFQNKDFIKYLGLSQNTNDLEYYLGKDEEDKNNHIQYDKFLNRMNSEKDKSKRIIFDKINQLFLHTYPIFNYKYSQDEPIYEMIQNASVMQPYGDYSSIGLNGNFEMHEENGKQIIGDYIPGAGSKVLMIALPTKEAQKILEQITEIVNLIAIVFIFLAMIISLIIILLVTTIIIYENSKFISTMKILGYQNWYVVWQILKIYFWAVGISYIIGFATALFALKLGINYLAVNSSWVLPFKLTIYMPFVVLLILLVIYSFTFIIALKQIKKITPISALSASAS
ncbi:ABC transporter permease [Spiroplasma endosymbiont of Crioceris asparagi]|uniref:ABC transporter permease n=1 Tax=Spiroplasma endosymbiont of Crioceris asparagi TaxID=3066286 RepID=UPI0030CB58E0